VASLRALLVALTQVTASYPGFVGNGAQERLAGPGAELLALVVDEQRPGTLAHAVRSLLDCAYAVRDQLSSDTWLVVGSLDRVIQRLRIPQQDPKPLVQGALQRVMQSLLALGGLGNESMVRDLGWRFMDAGRRIERTVQLLSLPRATASCSSPSSPRRRASSPTVAAIAPTRSSRRCSTCCCSTEATRARPCTSSTG